MKEMHPNMGSVNKLLTMQMAFQYPSSRLQSSWPWGQRFHLSVAGAGKNEGWVKGKRRKSRKPSCFGWLALAEMGICMGNDVDRLTLLGCVGDTSRCIGEKEGKMRNVSTAHKGVHPSPEQGMV